MSTYRCCEEDVYNDQPRPEIALKARGESPTLAGRALQTARWALPATLLAVLPKCPICLAAYIAVGTGIGVSITAASWLRMFLVAACLASLSLFAAAHVSRLIARRRMAMADRAAPPASTIGASGHA